MKNITLNKIAHELVEHYSIIDKFTHQHDLRVSDLPDFVRHEFSSAIITQEPEYGHEANGADNDAYEKTMLPALLRYLSDSTDRDAEIEFNNAWREGVTSYLTNRMQVLIDEALSDYNSGITYQLDRPILRTSLPGGITWY